MEGLKGRQEQRAICAKQNCDVASLSVLEQSYMHLALSLYAV